MRSLLLFIGLCTAQLMLAQKPSLAGTDSLVQVFGTVTDAVTGKPVLESTVEHYDVHGKRWSLTQVNNTGQYALFIPTGSSFELRVVNENGYADLSRAVEAIPRGKRSYRVDLRLRPE